MRPPCCRGRAGGPRSDRCDAGRRRVGAAPASKHPLRSLSHVAIHGAARRAIFDLQRMTGRQSNAVIGSSAGRVVRRRCPDGRSQSPGRLPESPLAPPEWSSGAAGSGPSDRAGASDRSPKTDLSSPSGGARRWASRRISAGALVGPMVHIRPHILHLVRGVVHAGHAQSEVHDEDDNETCHSSDDPTSRGGGGIRGHEPNTTTACRTDSHPGARLTGASLVATRGWSWCTTFVNGAPPGPSTSPGRSDLGYAEGDQLLQQPVHDAVGGALRGDGRAVDRPDVNASASVWLLTRRPSAQAASQSAATAAPTAPLATARRCRRTGTNRRGSGWGHPD